MMESIKQTALQLENTLLDFNIEAKVTGVSKDPLLQDTNLNLQLEREFQKYQNLTDNIALALASGALE